MGLCPEREALARGYSSVEHEARRSLAIKRFTFSCIFAMACRLLTSSRTLLGGSGNGARAITRLRSSQSFLPFPSRASSVWTRGNSIKHRPTITIPNNRHLQHSNVFSTAVKRSLEHKDGDKAEVGYSICAFCHIKLPIPYRESNMNFT